ncbi:MAG: hypothetical protein QHI38_02465 [Armatimonadota bacterium]|nr:hypothetical protein [Armatimonadota bacterium]
MNRGPVSSEADAVRSGIEIRESICQNLAPKRYVTPRAVAVGLVLIPVNSYWIFMMEIIRYQGHPTTISLFYSSIFNLVILILLNSLLRRFAPRWVFSQAELLTIYVMLNIGAALVGHDSIQILVSLMPYPAYFATPENRWRTLFVDKLPDWLVVKDPTAVKNFFRGGSLYDPANYGPWLVPVLWWSAFIIVLLLMFLCINVLLRKQWTERERLSYPLVQLPLDMTAEGAPLFREKLLWLGFGIAALIDIINGLAVLYPSIPMIPIKLEDQSRYFTTRPWNNIGWLPVQFYPFGIGLGILLPVDLLFSCWFFFWIWKLQRILTAAFGYDSIPNMPFVNEQSFGAYMGIAVFAIAVSRRHFMGIFRHFLGLKSEVDDKDEPIPYKAAVWGLILGVTFLFWFSRRAGLSGWVVVPFFLIYFAMCIAITRMRAELGPPAHDLHNGGPDTIIPNLVGPRTLGTQNLGVLSLYFWFNRAYRSHPMPFQLEGFKMAERVRMDYRGLFWAMLIAGVFGTYVAFWVILHLNYQYGGASSNIGPPNVTMIFGTEPWMRMDSWLKSPFEQRTERAVAIAIGFAVTILLNSLRMRISWFPFHPVGYAVSSSWSMHRLWLPMFIAWIIKLVILRYGGLKLYRQALPFFLGVILGECVVGSFWTIWGISFHIPSYAFWP